MVSTLFRGFELSYKYLKLIYMIGYVFSPFAYSFPNIGKHLVFTPWLLCLFILCAVEYYLPEHYLDVKKG